MRARHAVVLVAVLLLSTAAAAQEKKTDPETGLVIDEVGYVYVRGQCTVCHTAKLITQSAKTREGWEETIRWMQRTQGLWDLGPTEGDILAYLEKHYGLSKTSALRRQPLPAHLMPK